MLLAWQPTLGKGTSKSCQQPEELQEASQRLNLFLGSFALVFWFTAAAIFDI